MEEPSYYFLEWLQKFTSHQQCMRILFSPYPHQYSLFLVFLIRASLTCGKRYCDFDLHFSNDSWVWALFMCLVVVCRSSLKKISIQILCWFKKLDCLTFCSWVLWVLHIFWIFLIGYMIWNIFSHSVDCIHFVDYLFFCAKAFYFEIVLLIYFWSCYLCFWSQIEISTNTNVIACHLCFLLVVLWL